LAPLARIGRRATRGLIADADSSFDLLAGATLSSSTHPSRTGAIDTSDGAGAFWLVVEPNREYDFLVTLPDRVGLPRGFPSLIGADSTFDLYVDPPPVS
jgi:hypothetical protein